MTLLDFAAAALRGATRMKVSGLVALTLLTFAGGVATAAPSAELWPRWQAHDPESDGTIDHASWDRILQAHVAPDRTGVNRFAYAKVSAPDRAALEAYVAALTQTPISRYRREEQRAYWINLYNALTVKLILDHAPVESIRDIDISPGLFSDGPWGKALVTVEGEALSLDDIEHRILRPIWRDPRIHYAVNCASIGCPNLQPRAFTAANSEALLEAGARAYVNHPRGARVEEGRLVVSSIYSWFDEDFGDSDAGVIRHLKRYADPPLAQALEGITEIDDHEYDWALNG